MRDLISMHPQSTSCRGLPWIEYAAAVQNMSRRHRKASRRQKESGPRQKESKHHTSNVRCRMCSARRVVITARFVLPTAWELLTTARHMPIRALSMLTMVPMPAREVLVTARMVSMTTQ